MATYGLQSGNSTAQQSDSQLSSQAMRRKYNYQQQAPYAAQTGAAAAAAMPNEAQPLSPMSPVTPTGQISPASVQPYAQQGSATTPVGGISGGAPQRMANTTYQFGGDPLLDQSKMALMNALQNPVFTPDIINQMKGAQMDTIAQGTNQIAEGMASNAAGRGMTDSGAHAAGLRRLATEGLAQKTNSFRDIDIQTALGNRDDMRSNSQLALSNVLGEQGLYQGAADSALQGYGMDLNGWLQRYGIDTGAAVDRERIGLQRQLGLGELGLGWGQLDASNQQAIWNAIMRGAF